MHNMDMVTMGCFADRQPTRSGLGAQTPLCVASGFVQVGNS